MAGNDMPLVVMYHYVLESRESSPGGIRPMFADEFEEQLDWLEDHYRVVSPEELLYVIEHGLEPAGKPPCLLTFDDGTWDHWLVVAPILKRRSLTGLFSVLTWPSEHQKMPVTQALHWLMGQPEKEIWSGILSFADANLGGIQALGSYEDAMRTYHYEPELRALIKYAINFALAPETSEEIITVISRSFGKSMDALAGEWFLTEQQIKVLASSGMEIGIHGCSHRSASQLGPAAMAEEIIYSSSYLKALTNETPAWFCWPFGGSDLEEDPWMVLDACQRVGVKGILTTQRSFVTPETSPNEIPRYDCIHLPPRSNEIIEDWNQSK